MMVRSKTTAVLFAVLLVTALGIPAAMAQVDDETNAGDVQVQETQKSLQDEGSTNLTILTYNDLQGAVLDKKRMPRFATLVEQKRSSKANTLMVGSGDALGPHPLSPVEEWRPAVEILNMIKPDAEAIGNHDLDYGLGEVPNFTQASDFPWLAANIVDKESGKPINGSKAYETFERGGVKVGVIGVTNKGIKSKTAIDFNEQGVKIKDPINTTKKYATKLKNEKNVDVVVVTGQLGIPLSKEIANKTQNVDVISTGDDEKYYPPKMTSGTIIVEAKAQAKYLGEVNLQIKNGKIQSWNGDLIKVDKNISKDQEVLQKVKNLRTDTLNKVVGKTDVKLDARFSTNYHRESRVGNLITDSMKWKMGSDAAITNAGGIRSNSFYGPGNLTAGDILSILPFGNSLVTIELTGKEIRTLLRSQVVELESEEGKKYGAEPKLQVSGIKYEWVAHDVDKQIRDVYIAGEPMQPDKTYTVTINSYMAGWDGGVIENATRVDASNQVMAAAVIDRIEKKGTISPQIEDRIQRVDEYTDVSSASLDNGDIAVTFDAPKGTNEVGSFYATTDGGWNVEASDVTYSNDEITATFDPEELASLAIFSDNKIEIKGEYNTTEHKRVYFEYSILQSNIDISNMPTTELEISEVVDGPDNKVSFEELQTVIQYWASNKKFPLDKDEITFPELQEVITDWASA